MRFEIAAAHALELGKHGTCDDSRSAYANAIDALRDARSAIRHPRIVKAYQFYSRMRSDEGQRLDHAGKLMTAGLSHLRDAKKAHDSRCARPVQSIPLSGLAGRR